MDPMSFNARVLLSAFVGATVVGATALICYCGGKVTRNVPNKIQNEMQLINTLAQKILERPNWWRFDRPFEYSMGIANPDIKKRVRYAQEVLRVCAPSGYEEQIVRLGDAGILNDREPTLLLGRLIRHFEGSIQYNAISAENFRWIKDVACPNLGRLIDAIIACEVCRVDCLPDLRETIDKFMCRNPPL